MEHRHIRAEPDIATSIIASGIADEPVTHLVEGAMQRLVSGGVPLHRMQVGFRILHPLFDGMSVTLSSNHRPSLSLTAVVTGCPLLRA